MEKDGGATSGWNIWRRLDMDKPTISGIIN